MNDSAGKRQRPVLAGVAYFALAFLFGFVLGVLRTLAIEPRVGELAAVMLELPVMLLLSWFICRRLSRLFGLSPRIGVRSAMGAVAFVLLITAELAIVMPLRGMATEDYVGHLMTGAGALGLAGQVGYALIPVLQGLVDGRAGASTV